MLQTRLPCKASARPARPQQLHCARLAVRRAAVAVRASNETVSQQPATLTQAELPTHTAEAAQKYKWSFDGKAAKASDGSRQVLELPVAAIRRPLGRTRGNDQDKVAALMKSIEEIGLQEPIDVLEVEGVYYGFSGCHRFEAHQRLGRETIWCRVRKANREVLKMHMM